MPNKNQQNAPLDETSLIMPESPTDFSPEEAPDRRKKARQHDRFYQCVMVMNIIAWVLLIASLVTFHYARPEFITGVQNFWGIEGRDFWSQEHLSDLLSLLQICLLITIVTIVLRSRRNRRKSDGVGVNILILLVISITSLVTIYMTV
jgi:nitric oxide reductase large subunit